MLTLKDTLMDLSSEEAGLTVAENALKQLRENFDAKLAKILNLCRIPCLQAVEQFNSLRTDPSGQFKSLTIFREEIRISFDVENMKIDLFIRVCLSGGAEPYQGFKKTDVEMIAEVLAPFVETALREAMIPLTFGKLSVPSHYYLL